MTALLGRVNPSGRLSESFPLAVEDAPSSLTWTGERGVVQYGEGVFIGYRWYDALGRAVRYPFGHGLSYTCFSFADLRVTVTDPATGAVRITCTVANTGPVAGSEVVQLYVGDPDATVRRPVRELRGFEKVALQPAQVAEVAFDLTGRDFSHWDSAAPRGRRAVWSLALRGGRVRHRGRGVVARHPVAQHARAARRSHAVAGRPRLRGHLNVGRRPGGRPRDRAGPAECAGAGRARAVPRRAGSPRGRRETYVLGDQPLVLLTALQTPFEPDPGSCESVERPAPRVGPDDSFVADLDGRPIRVFTRLDTRLMFEDLFLKLAEHARWDAERD